MSWSNREQPPAYIANHAINWEIGPGVVADIAGDTLDCNQIICHRRCVMRIQYEVMEPTSRSTEFVALGHAGNQYAGLETFANPGVSHMEMTSDELTAICPVTGQPDLYIATIEFWPKDLCLESKSLKLYLSGYRNEGHFCEALAVKLRDDVAKVLGLPSDKVRVTLKQKARGGITITAIT